jgi:hypothetical protein
VFIRLLHARTRDDEIQHRGNAPFVGSERADDCSVHVGRIGYLLAVAFAGLRDLGEVRLHLEIGVDDPVAHAEFLDIADRAQRSIIEDAPGDAFSDISPRGVRVVYFDATRDLPAMLEVIENDDRCRRTIPAHV